MGPEPAGEPGTHLSPRSAPAQAPHGCHSYHKARGSAAARITAQSWSLQSSSSLLGAGCEMEAAEAPEAFVAFFFLGQLLARGEGVGGIVGMAPSWLFPALFLPQGPGGCLSGWTASGAWGREERQCAPGIALHHALATELVDPILFIPLSTGTVVDCLFSSSCTAGKALGTQQGARALLRMWSPIPGRKEMLWGAWWGQMQVINWCL